MPLQITHKFLSGLIENVLQSLNLQKIRTQLIVMYVILSKPKSFPRELHIKAYTLTWIEWLNMKWLVVVAVASNVIFTKSPCKTLCCCCFLMQSQRNLVAMLNWFILWMKYKQINRIGLVNGHFCTKKIVFSLNLLAVRFFGITLDAIWTRFFTLIARLLPKLTNFQLIDADKKKLTQ